MTCLSCTTTTTTTTTTAKYYIPSPQAHKGTDYLILLYNILLLSSITI